MRGSAGPLVLQPPSLAGIVRLWWCVCGCVCLAPEQLFYDWLCEMAQGAGPIIWEVSLWSESAFGIPKVTFLFFFLQYFLFVAKKCWIGNIQILVHIFLAVCVMIAVVCYLLMVPTTLSFCNWMEFWWDLQCCGKWNALLHRGAANRARLLKGKFLFPLVLSGLYLSRLTLSACCCWIAERSFLVADFQLECAEMRRNKRELHHRDASTRSPLSFMSGFILTASISPQEDRRSWVSCRRKWLPVTFVYRGGLICCGGSCCADEGLLSAGNS